MKEFDTMSPNVTAVLKTSEHDSGKREAQRTTAEILAERAKLIEEISARATKLVRSTYRGGALGGNEYDSELLKIATGPDQYDEHNVPITPQSEIVLQEPQPDGSKLVTTIKYNGMDAPCYAYRMHVGPDGETVLANLTISTVNMDFNRPGVERFDTMVDGHLVHTGPNGEDSAVSVPPEKVDLLLADMVADVNGAVEAAKPANSDEVLNSLLGSV